MVLASFTLIYLGKASEICEQLSRNSPGTLHGSSFSVVYPTHSITSNHAYFVRRAIDEAQAFAHARTGVMRQQRK